MTAKDPVYAERAAPCTLHISPGTAPLRRNTQRWTSRLSPLLHCANNFIAAMFVNMRVSTKIGTRGLFCAIDSVIEYPR